MLDSWRGDASALVAPLGHGRLVVDHLHAIRLANIVVDQGRRRVRQGPSAIGAASRILVPHPQPAACGRRAADRAGTSAAIGLAAGDLVVRWRRLAGQGAAPAAYAASDLADARAALEHFYRWADGVRVAKLCRLAHTIRAWEAEILAFHATDGLLQRPTEAVNLLSKKAKWVGYGFRNFANYRLWLLLHCGVRWQTHQTTSLRGPIHAWWRRAA